MKVAVVGGDGQLGCDVVRAFREAGHEVLALTHGDVEIRQASSIAAALSGILPELLVNTAALHDVERCERDPGLAFEINAVGAGNLAAWCARAGARLFHLSTDYVFDGRRSEPYAEHDLPAPLNHYGISKLAGEHAVAAAGGRHCILRTSGLYGPHRCRGKGPDFVERMLGLAREGGRLRVVDDETLTPTSTVDLAAQLVRLSESAADGLFHATAQGHCTWFGFAREIFRIAGIDARLERAEPGEFRAKTPRPAWSVLENHRLESLGLDVLPDWREGLRRHLEVHAHA